MYVGRANPRRGFKASPFGNPFKIGPDGDLADVIEKYEDYFLKLIEKPERKAEFEAMRGKRIGCWCKPKEGFNGLIQCHAQIIAAYLDDCEAWEVE